MIDQELTFDTNYLYVDQEKFFPILQEVGGSSDSVDSVNGVVIHVDCSIDTDFEWQDVYACAQQAKDLEKWILWELDFHPSQELVFLEDEAAFSSARLVIEEFIQKLWVPFQDFTLGACLFKGSVDFTKYFIWTEQHEILYLEKKQDSKFLQSDPSLDGLGRRLFAADVFSDYLERLASFFPENLLPFCLFDVSSVEKNSELALLLSKERFHHLVLALKKSTLPLGCLNWEEGSCFGGWVGRSSPYISVVHNVSVGVCVPLEENMNPTLLKRLDRVFDELDSQEVPYRVLSELYLNESWNGIDELIVFGSALSFQGLRKIKGFLAAGGQVVYVDEPIGIESEISLSEFSRR